MVAGYRPKSILTPLLMYQDTVYRKARKRVAKKKGFYKHLSSYLIMGIFFFVLNLLSDPGDWWFYWPMLGWGIGLAFHYVGVFGFPGLNNMEESWEEEEIQKEMRRLEKSAVEELPPLPDEKEDKLKLPDPEEAQKQWNDRDFV